MLLSPQYTSCHQIKNKSFLCCVIRKMCCVMRVSFLYMICYTVVCVCVNFACLSVRGLSHAQASAEWHSVTGMRIKQQIQRTKRWASEIAEEPVWMTWWAFRPPRQTSRSEHLCVGVWNDEFLSNVCVCWFSVINVKWKMKLVYLLTVMIVPQKHLSRVVNQYDRISLCVEIRVLNYWVTRCCSEY